MINPKVKLVSITPDYMDLLKLACSKPYGNDVSDKGVQAIIKSGHLSVLEHCYASFEVECSCRVLGQITRHRHLSFTVKSLRGSEGSKFVLPESLKVKPEDVEETYKEVYEVAKASDIPLEDVAYMLPQGTMTAMVVTGNFRAWYEYLPKRLCKRAMPEHREVAEGIQKELAKAAPEIFDKNLLNCANCSEGSCSFK
jgi:thymidylate synthase (FAD)